MGKSSPKPPPAPDYKQLAIDQAKLDQAAADRAAAANRPNQYTTQGQIEWTVDPETGQWTSRETLSPEQQYLYNQQVAGQQQFADTAMGQIGRVTESMANPFSYEGMTDVQGFDPSQLHDFGADLTPNADQMQRLDPSQYSAYGNVDYSQLAQLMPESGFGAVKDVQQAMLARLRPDLDQQRAQEIQRLKAQGFNETDEGFGNMLDRLNRKDVDAENQALLGATQAYGDIFNRGLAARQQGANEMLTQAQFANQKRAQQAGEALQTAGFNNELLNQDFSQRQLASAYANSLRGQQLGEQNLIRTMQMDDRARQIQEALMQRSLPLQEYQQLMGQSQAQMPRFENFSNVAGSRAADIAGAAQKQYSDAMSAYNADQASSSALTGQILGTIGTIGGAMIGGPAGAAIGGSLGGMLAPKANYTPTYSWQPNASGGISPVIQG